MILPITSLVAAILIFWYIYTSLTVSFTRGAEQVSLGEGAVGSTMQRIVRVHGNAAEYIPLFIILVALLEYHGLRPEVLYVLSGVFLLGRFFHRQAILRAHLVKRIWAMQCTLWPLGVGALILVYTWFSHTWLLG